MTEAPRATPVECPYCGREFTAFAERGTPDAAKPRRSRRRDDEDDDAEWQAKRGQTSGSAVLVLLVGGFGLLLVMAGLGGLVYLILTDEPDKAAAKPSDADKKGKETDTQPAPVGGLVPRPGIAGPRVTPRQPEPPPEFPGKSPRTPFTLRPVAVPVDARPPAGLDVRVPKTIPLPGKLEKVVLGGGGRYLVVSFPDQQQVGVIDLSEARLASTTPFDFSGRGGLAVGATRVLLASGRSGPDRTVQVRTLPTLGLESSAVLGIGHPFAGAAMGAFTDGPVLLSDPFGDLELYDPTTRQTVPGTHANLRGSELRGFVNRLRASGDGRVYAADLGSGGDGCAFITERNGAWVITPVTVQRSVPPLLSSDGQTAFIEGGIIDVPSGQLVGPRVGGHGNAVWYVPAVSGTYFLRLAEGKVDNRSYLDVSVCKDRNPNAPVARIGALPEAQQLVDWVSGRAEPFDRHLFLIPGAKMLAVIPQTCDRVMLYAVDMP